MTALRFHTLPTGAKAVDWTLPKYYAELVGKSPLWRDRKATALAMQHTDGISIFFVHAYSKMMRIAFFSYAHHGMDDVHEGVVLSTRRAVGRTLPSQPALLERIPRTFGDHIAARRRCGEMTIEDAPDLYRKYHRQTDPEICCR